MRYGTVSWTSAAPENRPRILAALAAAAVQVLLVWVLVTGLTVHIPHVIERSMAVFGVIPEPPPPPPERVPPPPRHSSAAKGSPAPPNLRSRATPVAAPPPIIPVPAAPVMVTAPKPYVGAEATTGASDIAGPGTGAGGRGNGYGGGGEGDGGTGPRWRSGRLKDSDYPAGAGQAGVSGTVAVRYLVDTDGRVKECDVTRSSGSPALDDTTCRLIEKRFRFSPARDERGRPVPAWIVENHSWVIEHDPTPPDEDDRGR